MSHADAETVFADNPTTNAARWDGVQWTPYPDPIRPPETDEEPWTVGYLAVGSEADRPAVLVIPLAFALVVIVGILVAWAVR